MLAILNKELRTYFCSGIAYIFMTILLFFGGIFTFLYNVYSKSGDYASTLSSLSFIFVFIMPILTMKTIADETKTRTDQLLLTSPQKISSIVFGKFLAALILFGITLLITFLYPLLLTSFGKVAIGETISAYIGVFLLGACFIAVGIFISALSDSQVVAAVGTLGVTFVLWILKIAIQGIPSSLNTSTSGIIFTLILIIAISLIIYINTKNYYFGGGVFLLGAIILLITAIKDKAIFEGFIGKFFGWISVVQRNDTFTTGIISVNSIIYFISFTFIFLFLTARTLDKKRWS
ncbi:ABC transporter permease [Clostridium sp. 19966]|uniref:ABC transporter permease n=1 Tax=Clostridium sp. 19966 TaxID=2768166 RepID=UPI0028DFB092|nr:ABC transporter permease [Clostridium sp. 19966]MDT8719116.1 ABC transporter permease [Clostridium sp. 19966]